MESVEQGAPGDVKRKRAKQSNSDCSPSLNKRGQPLWIRELSTAGSTACQQTMSTPEEQMTMAVQQLYVQLQQLQVTLTTILQAACHVDHHTRRTDDTCGSVIQTEIIAVDQRNELELTTTEESSTPRLNGALSTLM